MRLHTKLMFFAVMTFNLVLRYPKSSLEKGSDSFGNHLISQAIIDQGLDERFIRFLSFFGLFPGSNNMGSAFILSATAVISDLSIHQSIFLLPFFFSLIGSLSMFLFAREVTYNTKISIFSVLLFTTSRKYLSITTFTYTYRSLYLSLLPLLLFFVVYLLRGITKKSRDKKISFKFVLLIPFLLLALTSIHRLVFLNGLLVFSFLVILIYVYFSRSKYNTGLNFLAKIKKPYKIFFATLFLTALYTLSIYGYFIYSGSSEHSLEEGKRFINSDFIPFTVINIGLMYSTSFGVLLPLSVIGYISLFYRKDNIGLFLVVLLLFYSLIWTDLTYGFLALLPIIALLVSLGIGQIVYKTRKIGMSQALAYSVAFVILLCGQAVPEFVVITESEYSYIKDNKTYDRAEEYVKAYNTGIYLSQNDHTSPLITHSISSTRIAAYSGTPSPGNSETFRNAEDFAYTQVDFMVFLTGNLDHLYAISDDNLERSTRYDIFLAGEEWNKESIRINVNRVYGGDDSYILGLYAPSPSDIQDDQGTWLHSLFFESAIDQNYKFYDNGFHLLYDLDYS